jgi:hypothetical protein
MDAAFYVPDAPVLATMAEIVARHTREYGETDNEH